MTLLTTLRARYVFPVVGDPIPDGFVAVEGERIVAVGHCGAGRTPAPQEICDLGNVAILPGLVNAHIHLDFSGLRAPLGQRGIALADWIRLAMDYRRAADSSPSSVTSGLCECVRGGVTTLGDIVQANQPPAASPLDVTAFIELIAPTAGRVAAAVELARSHLNVLRTRRARGQNVAGTRRVPVSHTACADYIAGNIAPGLSPHAPYSVHPELLAVVIGLSIAEAVPVAMHLAESPEELELLRDGTGPLRTLLEELGAVENSRGLTAPGGIASRPMDYLRSLAAAHRTLVVHGNYLADDEIAFLGTNAARMAAVYCPRSHDWFTHRAYPLEKMLAAGVTVALGTDGRGSVPDLSLLAEMRFAARRHPGIGLDQILRMGTILGAKALGREDEVGSLLPGKWADLAIVALPDRDATDPHELLFNSEEPVVACYCRGKEIMSYENSRGLTAPGGKT